jgi:hypothetical protein
MWKHRRLSHRKLDLSMENRLHQTVEDNQLETCYDLQMFQAIANSSNALATDPKDPRFC